MKIAWDQLVSLSDKIQTYYGLESHSYYRDDLSYFAIFVSTQHFNVEFENDANLFLTDGEKIRAGKFVNKADGIEYTTAHAILKLALIAAGYEWKSFYLHTPSLGAKPVLRGIGNCQYPDVSLSHTKGGVVVGISWDYRIGVDVEKGDRREILDNARYFCTDNELKQAILHNQRNNEGYFVSLWVAKEAILKSAGLGLLVNPTNIEIEVKTQKIVELRSKDLQPFDWELKICQPTVSHLLAVALSKRIFQ